MNRRKVIQRIKIHWKIPFFCAKILFYILRISWSSNFFKVHWALSRDISVVFFPCWRSNLRMRYYLCHDSSIWNIANKWHSNFLSYSSCADIYVMIRQSGPLLTNDIQIFENRKTAIAVHYRPRYDGRECNVVWLYHRVFSSWYQISRHFVLDRQHNCAL